MIANDTAHNDSVVNGLNSHVNKKLSYRCHCR